MHLFVGSLPIIYMHMCRGPTCMNVSMFLHIRLLVESLSAVLTRIRPRIAVDEQVGGEGGRAFEALSTLFTLETPLLLLLRLVVLVRLRCSALQMRQDVVRRGDSEQRAESTPSAATIQLKDTLPDSASR